MKSEVKFLDCVNGYIFLANLENNFFEKIISLEKLEKIFINYASIASILVVSYFLNENDLHKNNIGFYLVKKEGRIEIVFFKIDHDMMFYYDISSKLPHGMRLNHIFYRYFSQFSARDIRSFPQLQDEVIHYWPTEDRFFNIGNKAYQKNEAETWKALQNHPEFIHQKWLAFLKILAVDHLIILKTKYLLPKEFKFIPIITNTILKNRIKNLKNVLFDLEEFIIFLNGFENSRDFDDLKTEIEIQFNIDEETSRNNLKFVVEMAKTDLPKVTLKDFIEHHHCSFGLCSEKDIFLSHALTLLPKAINQVEDDLFSLERMKDIFYNLSSEKLLYMTKKNLRYLCNDGSKDVTEKQEQALAITAFVSGNLSLDDLKKLRKYFEESAYTRFMGLDLHETLGIKKIYRGLFSITKNYQDILTIIDNHIKSCSNVRDHIFWKVDEIENTSIRGLFPFYRFGYKKFPFFPCKYDIENLNRISSSKHPIITSERILCCFYSRLEFNFEFKKALDKNLEEIIREEHVLEKARHYEKCFQYLQYYILLAHKKIDKHAEYAAFENPLKKGNVLIIINNAIESILETAYKNKDKNPGEILPLIIRF